MNPEAPDPNQPENDSPRQGTFNLESGKAELPTKEEERQQMIQDGIEKGQKRQHERWLRAEQKLGVIVDDENVSTARKNETSARLNPNSPLASDEVVQASLAEAREGIKKAQVKRKQQGLP